MRAALLLTLAAASVVSAQESWCDIMPPVEASLLSPGLRMAVADIEGLSQVLFHYNINKPLPGVSAGDWYKVVTSATDGYFAFDNPAVEVTVGDTVNGWYQTHINGEGQNCLEQSWIVVDDNTTTISTTTAAPTETDPPTPTTTTATTTTTTTAAPTETEPPTNPPGVSSDTPTTGPTTDAPPNTPPPAGTDAPGQPDCTDFPCLVFEDNFDFLDFHKWEHELTLGGGGNWEFQQYGNNRSNSYVRDGIIYIKPTLTEDKFGEEFLWTGTLDIHGSNPPNVCTGGAWYGCMRVGTPDNYLNPVQSARLRTSTGFYTRYGRVETRARMPAGDWLWPAIWMQPRFEEYGTWPTSGEIDIVESRGNADLKDETGKQRGNTHGGSTLHWGPFFEANRYQLTNGDFDGDLADNFHEYAVEWNKDGFSFELDGAEVLRVAPPSGGFWELGDYDTDFPGVDNPWKEGDFMAPFDTEFYITMNVAVGGTMGFWPDGWTNAGYEKPWNNESPFAPREFHQSKSLWYPTWKSDENNGEAAAMAVDYIRVYKMSDDDMNR